MTCQVPLMQSGQYSGDLQKIQYLWHTCNKCTAIEQILANCFSSAENPYAAALFLMSNTEGYLLSKKTSLAFYVMESFKMWLKNEENENLQSYLTPALKLESFQVVNQQKNLILVKLVTEIYQLIKDNELFLPYIRDKILSQKFKQACESAAVLKLHSHFGIKDFLVQLIFQDKLTVVEDFLKESPAHQQGIVLFMDELLGKRNVSEELRSIVEELKVADVNQNKFKAKTLNKLVGRYIKLYKLPLEYSVNYTYHQKKRALSYLIRKRYDDENLEGEGWKEMVLDNVKDSLELQYVLIEMLVDRYEVNEAFYWSKFFELELEKLPANVRFCYGDYKCKDVQEEESWDDDPEPSYLESTLKLATNAKKSKSKSLSAHYDDAMLDDVWDMETTSGSASYNVSDNIEDDEFDEIIQPMKKIGIDTGPLQREEEPSESKALEQPEEKIGCSTKTNAVQIGYYPLSLPESSVVVVDTVECFKELLEVGLKGVNMVGLDCEWKPSFTSKKNGVALVQLSTWNRIYLIDVLAFPHHCHHSLWTAFNQEVFENAGIIKLGFGIKTDKAMVLESIPQLKGYGSSSFLDLASLWKALTNNYSFRFPYQVENEPCGNSLAQLICICFGQTLDKSDQFSNWENRPLRSSQKIYAALDAYCLLEVYDYLKNTSLSQNIPFDELIAHSLKESSLCNVRQQKGKSKKHRKIIDPMSFLETQTTNVQSLYPPNSAQSIRMLCDNMVYGLGRKLRSCGIDTWIPQMKDDADACVKISLRDHRVILTRGANYRKFVSYVGEEYCYQIKSDSMEEQIKEVLTHFNIVLKKEDIFSRCQVCNGHTFAEIHNALMKKIVSLPGNRPMENDAACGSDATVVKNRTSPAIGQRWPCRDEWSITELREVIDVTRKGAKMKLQAIPLDVISIVEYFYACEKCGKIYWNGSHWENEVVRKKEINLIH